MKPVAKDGNCLFSAVDLGDKSTVREVAVDWSESHLDDDLWGGYTYRSYIEEEKKAAEREKQMIELELRLLEAAGEIEHRLQVLERGLPLSANRADASGDED